MFRRDAFSSRVEVVKYNPAPVYSLGVKQLLDEPEEQAGFTDFCEPLALEIAASSSQD